MISLLDEHLGYVADRVRLKQFRSAIAQVVKPGDQVADLGCGSGVLGLLCLNAGAGQVTAIDSSTVIEIARESMRRAGHSERAMFIRGDSRLVELPQRVDVVICDHVGYFGFDYGLVEILADARRRFLRPGGRLIPERIRLHAAAVCSRKFSELTNGWEAEAVPPEFHWLRSYAINAKHAVDLHRDDVLGASCTLGEIDLCAQNPEFHSWTADLRVGRKGIVNGVAGWFECELATNIWMTNSPLAEESIQRPQVFLPIAEAVPVMSGDVVKVGIMARPADNLIAWVVEFPATGQRFSQSTLQGMLLSAEDVSRTNPNRVPKLNRAGLARMTVLAYCDGTRTAQDIAQAVLRDHPDLFPSPPAISDFVSRVLGRDTE